MSLYEETLELASTWADSKKRSLSPGQPDTKVDSGGSKNSHTFDGQEIDRDELRDVRDMRETGGVISQLVHAKAMMQFGTGASFQAEEDEASEWLADQFNDLDNLLIEIGEDATWFPAGYAELVETRGGDFSHVELIEPWTMLPVENEFGEVVAYEQQIQGDYSSTAEVFEPDEIAAFVLNKCSGRDKTGISDVLQAEDEVRNFKENQQTINDALEFLIPHNHWKVGREGGTVIDDNELRRVRNLVDDMEGDTQIITGRDVDQEPISLDKFDVQQITNNDLRQVCVALGVPIELASVISEGLGSGEQSSVRETFFELEKRAKQRALGGQFVEQIARVLLEEYSPYDSEQQLDLVFQESETLEEKQTVIDAIGDTLTNNEKREAFDYAPLDDDEVGEAFEAPGESSEDDGMGGLFAGDGTGNRHLEDTPEWDAHFIDLHERVWNADADKQLFSISDSATPEFVKDRIKDAIRGGAVFSDFANIPSSELMQLREYLTEELAESDGWTIDGVAGRLQDLDANLSRDEAEVIARTETASTLNTARQEGYKERGDGDELFYWTGAYDDGRTTTACQWLMDQTHPQHDGEPVSLERLKELVDEAPEHDPEMDDDLARPENLVVHPSERKTFVKWTPGTFE